MFQLHVDAANADLHFKELMAGANGNSRIQFIVIEQQQGQNLWGPQAGEPESRDMLVFFDATGRETGKFKFPTSPLTGGSLQTLIATQEFANLPGAPIPDVIIPPLLTPIVGKVCFKNNPANVAATSRNECVSYGTFTGDTEVNFVGNNPGVPAGPPAAALPIVDTVSLRRTINTGTNSDFQLTTSPTPTNIAGASLAIVVASAIEQGGNLFNKETFQGNGRTCATCHVANDNLRLSPSNIQSRFATLASPTFSFDPLFIAESKPSSFDAGFDFNLNTLVLVAPVATPAPCTGELRGDITTANGGHGKVLARVSSTTYLVYGGLNPMLTGVVTDGVCSSSVSSITAGNLAVPAGTNPPGLEDPKLMRTSASAAFPQGRGLILENIDGFSNPAVFRKSPHLLNLSRTGPFGLSGDIPDLRTFATGAVKQHFPRTLARNSSGPNPDFRLPTPEETAAMEAFMKAQEFPAGNDPNKFDLDRFATTNLQRLGRAQFFGTTAQPNCSSCHGGPLLSQTTVSIQGKPIGVNASFNTGAANLIFSGDNVPCEPGTTNVGACNSREFSVPQLFNVNNLGPFFHNASASPLQSAINFYASAQFTSSPANIAMNAQGLFLNVGAQIGSFLTGLSVRPYTLTSGPIRFGLQTTNGGPTAPQSITVTNTSSSSITFSGLGCSLTGTDATQFVITSCPLTNPLAPGQSATVTVSFDPSSSGLKSAILEVNAQIPSGVDLFGVGDVLPAAPTLTGIVAASGTADGGDSVTLTGTNFTSGATLTIGGVRAGFAKVVNSTSITARTGPHAPGVVDVVVTNPDGQSATLVNGFNFTSSSPLSLTSVTPVSGSSLGSTITVNGTGFQSGAAVTLGGVAATNVNVVTSTTITATTPAHAPAAVNLCVTNIDGQQACLANAYTYVFAPAPILAALTPGSGSYLGGTDVTLQGAGFAPGSTVTFGGVAAAVFAVTPTTMRVRTSPHALGVVDVIVTNADGQTATLANAFSYLPPTITSISPNSGSTVGGTSVGIFGNGFASGATVTFGGSPATILSQSGQTSIGVASPAHGAGVVNVVVTNPDGQTASFTSGFNYILPTITSMFPTSGTTVGGTSVSINGSGFGPGATVTFGGLAATVTSSSETFITARTPAHSAGSVNAVVTNTNGSVATSTFTYVLPSITLIGPSSGGTGGGTSVTINGSGFGQGATVTFGGLAGTVTFNGETSITATTPAHAAGSVDVVVTNPNGTTVTRLNGFTYVVPAITSISPNSGGTGGGTSVTVAGAGFAQGATVTFGGSQATVAFFNETSINVTTPAHAAGSVTVVVTNPNGATASLSNGYTYALPTITSISPTTGNTGGGTSVTINGSGFAQGATVTFGGAAATVTSTSETSISATTPAHAAGIVDVVVTNPNATTVTRANGFTYVLPSITSISPNSGSTNGGTRVTINGAGFAQGIKVTFGGVSATNVTAGDTFVLATAPPHAAGIVDVVVTNPNSTSATSINAFTYILPTITSINPNSGNTGGGTSVNINGSGFAQGAIVTFGGVPATFVSGGETFLSATTPPHTAGLVNVVVTNPNGASATSVNGFNYVQPAITSISPNTGNTGGGISLNIGGSGFSQGATVTFGGVAATSVSGSETFLSATTPAHVAGSVNVVVTNPNGTSATSVNGFTYVLPSITSIGPTTGSTGGGTFVSIRGAGFSSGATVTFGGASATNVSASDTIISATTPAHSAGSVDVVVTNPNGTTVTSANLFTYVLPTITGISPSSGPSNGGTFVTISGSGFAQGATVTFGGVAVTNVFSSGDSFINISTPTHATGSVNVVVTNPNGATSTVVNGFTYQPSVTITSLGPISGSSLGGTPITINGDGFANGATVKTGGVRATNVNVLNSATLTAVTGPHPAGLVDVVVTNSNGISGTMSNAFTYVAAPPPQVFLIAPVSGSSLGGTSVTVTGGAFAPGATLKIGGSPATNVVFVNSGMLTAVTGPRAAGLVDVVVTNPDAQSGALSNAFTFVATAPPTVSSIVPASGSTFGGTPVTIVGTGFGNGVAVTIGGQPATNVTFVNSTTIVATTGARSVGVVDVVFTNPDSQSVTLPTAFTYTSTPSNDNFANRFPIVGTGPITATGSNVGAAAEAGEPSDLLGQGSGTPSVWWTWTATCSFSVSSPSSFISTSGSGFDTVLGVFTGSSLNSLVLFASDDDSGGNLNSQIPSASQGPSTLNIVAGTVFQIRVRGFSNSSSDTIMLHIDSPCGITAVTPSSGPFTGGTNVTVIGSGFTNGATVAFGGVNASGVNVVNSTTITATTGPHAGGPVDVTVTNNPNQTTATLPSGFTFTGGPRRRGQITSQ